MTDLEKLEYIHCAIQEVQNDIRKRKGATGFLKERDIHCCEHDDHMIAQALSFVEDIREPLLQEQSNDRQELQSKWQEDVS